jgi:predicted nucleic acid-binding protein
MAGKVIDLNDPKIVFPSLMLLDTSVIASGFVPNLRTPGSFSARSRAQIASMLTAIRAQGSLVLIATTTWVELAHLVIRAGYQRDMATHPSPATGRPFPSWAGLYKQHPRLVRTYAADIERLRLVLVANDVEVLQPQDLGLIASGRRFEEELIRLVRRYRLDSADVAILLEARRAGITSVFSEDPDWRRAARDFEVYTWL